MTTFWIVMLLLVVVGVVVGGYLYNRGGPGDHVRNPDVKPRRNNWVP